jgi:two-component system NtrC family sensor kinase
MSSQNANIATRASNPAWFSSWHGERGDMSEQVDQSLLEFTPSQQDRNRPHVIFKLLGRLRLTGLQSKLIVPYVVLSLLVALIGTYIVTSLVVSSVRERFVNRLYESSLVSLDSIVRRERLNLQELRSLVFTIGIPEAMVSKNIAQLVAILEPILPSRNIDVASVIDLDAQEILTLGKDYQNNQYVATQGRDFSSHSLVINVLARIVDEEGDKFVGLLETSYGLALFTSAPVYSDQGELVGVMLVGTYLKTIVSEMKGQAEADIVLLDNERRILETSLAEPQSVAIPVEAAAQLIDPLDIRQTIDLELYEGRDYQVHFTPFSARGGQIGWLGTILSSNYVVATVSTSRNLFVTLFTFGTICTILIGYLLSQSIAKPILRLRSASQAVASGDLNQQVSLTRSDEIGDLAEAFDQMTIHLRERTEEAARLYAVTVQRNKELAEINAQLQAAQLQLIQSEKLAAIGQLTAGIVHDVKNPLTVIKGMSEVIVEDNKVDAQTLDEIRIIRDSAEKANRIVSDLLKFARQSRPEMTRQDLRETIDACLRLTAYLIREAHVQVIKDMPQNQVLITYDAQQIEQVLLNMIANATQAMPDGGVLRINLSQADGAVAVAIQDTGTGIAPENLGRIFDPFFTTKPEGKGTGLGLSVSYGIIANHRGQIAVDSTLGKGTIFTILLPTEQPVTAVQSTEADKDNPEHGA